MGKVVVNLMVKNGTLEDIHKGKRVEPGVYVWVVFYIDFTGLDQSESGVISLIF